MNKDFQGLPFATDGFSLPQSPGRADPGQYDFFRFAVEVSAEALLLLRADAQIVYANRSACDRLGYSRPEMLGMPVWHIDPDFNETLWRQLWDELLDKQTVRFEGEHHTKYGEVIPVEVQAHAFAQDDERFVLAYVQDLSEKRQLQQQNRELERRCAEAAEQASAQNRQFLANISHELRTPMHAVLSYAKLGMKRSDDEKVRGYLQNISVSAKRLTGLLDDVLELTSLENGGFVLDIGNHDLHAVFQDVRSEIEPALAEKAVSLTIDCEGMMPGQFDRGLMHRVVFNLLSNAIRYSPRGGMIGVRLRKVRESSEQWPGGVLEFLVGDQGPGIKASEREAIFDVLTHDGSTDNNPAGASLGLPICKEIIGYHRGEIQALPLREGQEGGATFMFRIPRAHRC